MPWHIISSINTQTRPYAFTFSTTFTTCGNNLNGRHWSPKLDIITQPSLRQNASQVVRDNSVETPPSQLSHSSSFLASCVRHLLPAATHTAVYQPSERGNKHKGRCDPSEYEEGITFVSSNADHTAVLVNCVDNFNDYGCCNGRGNAQSEESQLRNCEFDTSGTREARTKSNRKLQKALSLPSVRKAITAPTIARPANPTPMQYRTNMALLAISMASIASSTCCGHLRSESLTCGSSSLCRTSVALKLNKAV